MTPAVIVVDAQPSQPAAPENPPPVALEGAQAVTTEAIQTGIELGANLGEATAARAAAELRASAAESQVAQLTSERDSLMARTQALELAEAARVEAEQTTAAALNAPAELVEVPAAEPVADVPKPITQRNWLMRVLLGR